MKSNTTANLLIPAMKCVAIKLLTHTASIGRTFLFNAS